MCAGTPCSHISTSKRRMLKDAKKNQFQNRSFMDSWGSRHHLDNNKLLESITWKNPFLRATHITQCLNFTKPHWSYNLVLWSDETKIKFCPWTPLACLVRTGNCIRGRACDMAMNYQCFAVLVKNELWILISIRIFQPKRSVLQTHPNQHKCLWNNQCFALTISVSGFKTYLEPVVLNLRGKATCANLRIWGNLKCSAWRRAQRESGCVRNRVLFQYLLL